jgi:reactive intermediate/imine deaminase
MTKQNVVSPQLAEPNGHFAQATAIEARGKLVFISGMTARTKDGGVAGIGDITAQTHQVCQNLRAAVEAAGGTLDDICRVDVFVRNMEDFDDVHAVRRQYFTGVAPASTMVEVAKFVNKDYLIEINAIAVVQNGLPA